MTPNKYLFYIGIEVKELRFHEALSLENWRYYRESRLQIGCTQVAT